MSSRRLRALPFVSVLALALLVSACGGGASKDDYEAGLARVQAKLEDANEALQEAAEVAAEDAAGRSEALGEARTAIDAAADEAERLDPPEEAARAHDQLATALRDYAALFGTLASLDEGDERQSELYGEAGEIVERLDAANRSLEKAGFRVPRSSDA